jgi:hypothetical protein
MEGSTGSPTAGEHEPLDGDEEEGEEEEEGAEQDDKVALPRSTGLPPL